LGLCVELFLSFDFYRPGVMSFFFVLAWTGEFCVMPPITHPQYNDQRSSVTFQISLSQISRPVVHHRVFVIYCVLVTLRASHTTSNIEAQRPRNRKSDFPPRLFHHNPRLRSTSRELPHKANRPYEDTCGTKTHHGTAHFLADNHSTRAWKHSHKISGIASRFEKTGFRCWSLVSEDD